MLIEKILKHRGTGDTEEEKNFDTRIFRFKECWPIRHGYVPTEVLVFLCGLGTSVFPFYWYSELGQKREARV